MTRNSILSMMTFLFCVVQLCAQATLSTQDFNFQISPAQPWIDTGLNLQAGDVLEISASSAGVPSACDPNGVSKAGAQTANLPLPSVLAGALIARLHAQGAAPLLLGANSELRIEEASHLFLGLNVAGNAVCQGAIAVKVHKVSAGSTATNASAESQEQTRKEQLKSQLENAAQIFMSGQFGTSKSESSANPGSSNLVPSGNAPADAESASVPLTVSSTPLDAGLRKNLDNLPRRVNDQLQNLGDMVNFAIVGAQKDVLAALDAANWHVADSNNEKAVLSALMETYENKDYLQMPMSTLYLFGRRQDFGYEMAEPIAMIASRHHLRIWKAPFTWNGKEVWVGAGTHDIGFAKDKRNGSVTHKIDPAVDGERDNIGRSLQKANQVKSLSYYLPPNAVQEAKNATGDGYRSDGRLLLIFLK
jgi:hypothetical protein